MRETKDSASCLILSLFIFFGLLAGWLAFEGLFFLLDYLY